MAGSKKWFLYTTKNGDDFAINLDESNTEAANGTGLGLTLANATDYAVPRNIRPRTATFANPARTRIITCTILTETAYDAITAGETIADPLGASGDPALSYIRKRAELTRTPLIIDTGLIDGDQP